MDRLNSINEEGLKRVQEYNIEDRTEQFRASTPRVTLKDHKEDFLNRPAVRLINLSNSIDLLSVSIFVFPKLSKIKQVPHLCKAHPLLQLQCHYGMLIL